MAGPSFTILLRAPLTQAQVQELDAWLSTWTVDLERRPGTLAGWYFRVEEGSVLGLVGPGATCGIGIALVEPAREWSGDQEEQIMLRLGFWPRQGMQVSAMCKTFPTGRVMSYLILRLMERYEGYLSGVSPRQDIALERPEEPPEHAQVSPPPGSSIAIRYWDLDPATGYSKWWRTELVDVERLRWWLREAQGVLPYFRGAQENQEAGETYEPN